MNHRIDIPPAVEELIHEVSTHVSCIEPRISADASQSIREAAPGLQRKIAAELNKTFTAMTPLLERISRRVLAEVDETLMTQLAAAEVYAKLRLQVEDHPADLGELTEPPSDAATKGLLYLGTTFTHEGGDPDELANIFPPEWIEDQQDALEQEAQRQGVTSRAFFLGLLVAYLLTVLMSQNFAERTEEGHDGTTRLVLATGDTLQDLSTNGVEAGAGAAASSLIRRRQEQGKQGPPERGGFPVD